MAINVVNPTLRPALLAALLLIAGPAGAVGTGTIADGAGSITQQGRVTTVTQASEKLIVNWDNMDVAQRETLNFAQPGATSAVLNRIDSPDPTTILGTLNANGRVFIVNPNGVLVGNRARINVGSLVASSLALSDDDFNADRLHFSGGGNGDVVNRGKISASESVALLGPNTVRNTGSIQARHGNVVLAAGDDVRLTFAAGTLHASLTQGSLRALVENGGLIAAGNGDIELTAWARDALARSVVNNTGVLEAKRLNGKGDIELASLGSGSIHVGGSLKLRRAGKGSGVISMRGAGIDIADGATLDAGSRNGTIALFTQPADEAAGYVTFGRAKLTGKTLDVMADNVLTAAEDANLPTLDTQQVLLGASQARHGLTLGQSVNGSDASRLRGGNGAVSAGFIKEASRRQLLVETEGTGGIATTGRLEVGALELSTQQGDIRLDGDIAGRSLTACGADVALSGTTRTDTLNVGGDNVLLNGNHHAKRLLLHGSEQIASSSSGALDAADATLSGGHIDLTRGDIRLARLKVEAESADLALNGDTRIGETVVWDDLRVRGQRNLSLDDVYAGGNLDVLAQGDVHVRDVVSDGERIIRGANVVDLQ